MPDTAVPPSPAPAPAPVNPTPAPVAPAPTPAPQPTPTPTPTLSSPPSPKPAPNPNQRKPYTTAEIILVLLFGLLAAAAIIFYALRGAPLAPSPSANINPTPIVTTPVASSTPEVATSTPAYIPPPVPLEALGSSFRLFQGDQVNVADKTGAAHWMVTANAFTDSRCPAGDTCVVAGERTVQLTVQVIGQVDQPTLSLGTVNAKSGSVLGLTLKLQDIDDAKGGTYADLVAN